MGGMYRAPLTRSIGEPEIPEHDVERDMRRRQRDLEDVDADSGPRER